MILTKVIHLNNIYMLNLIVAPHVKDLNYEFESLMIKTQKEL